MVADTDPHVRGDGARLRPWPWQRGWRQSVRAVYRHEWRLLAHAPMTPVFLGGLLVTLAALVFVAGDFYATDRASVELQWTFLPWAALVFVPALAMRAFADDTGERGLELMQAMPLSAGAIVTGTWAAGTAMLLVGLAGTAPFVATVAYLGSPDWGALLGGYVGAALLLAAFYALALLAAALVRDMAAAYVLGLLLVLAALLAGWDVAQRQFDGPLGSMLLAPLAALSPKPWLDRLASGRLDPATVAAFVVVTGLCLAGARSALQARRRGSLATGLSGRGVALAAGAVIGGVAIAALAGRVPLSLDLTSGGEFTLHPETIAAARTVPPGTRIDVYWSADQRQIPAAIRAHARRTQALLQALSARSGGRLTVTVHDATTDSDAEAAALSQGLSRVPMSSGDSFVLGATITHGERRGAIPYFDVRRDQLVEYDIALALATLGRARTPRIGLLSPLLLPRHVSEPREGLAVIEDIKRSFDVAIIPHFADALPQGLDVVVVIGAAILKTSMLYALDQHVMAGKGLIVLIDPYARFDGARDVAVPQPSVEINDISDLLLKYGVRFHPEGVVGDAELASPVVGEGQRQISYPFWLRLGRDRVASAHPVTASLNALLFAEAGTLSPATAEAATALVTTRGPATGILSRAAAGDKSSEALAQLFTPDGQTRTLAAALHGPFDSAFAGKPDGTGATLHQSRSPASTPVFAVADIDFLFDPMSMREVTMGDKVIARPANDNAALLLNMIEYATGDPRLLASRGRGSLQRPFTRVAALLSEAQQRHRSEEARLAAIVTRIDSDVRKVMDVAGVTEISGLPAAVQARIRTLTDGLRPVRRALRQIRLAMREDVERLGQRLMAINLAAGPLFALAFACLMRLTRHRAQPPQDTGTEAEGTQPSPDSFPL